jgi:hypothetical protein
MAKIQRNAKQNKNKKVKRPTAKKNSRLSKPSNPTFGAVSTINTAPVAIGNSLRGSQPVVLQTVDGVRVIGRDFGFTPGATGAITTWCLVGGMPLTPCCMPSTALRNFSQMYNKFKFNGCNFHYITSSATSTTGDILFQYNKNADSSNPNWNGNSFLPYILSDPMTVLGPQWTNHTLTVKPSGPFRATDYGLSAASAEYTQGDIFLYSKTSSTDSPGYVIFDYDITFKELSVNPRAGLLPTIKAQWNPVNLGSFGSCTVASTTMIGTTSADGVDTITNVVPTLAIGEIYKFILDVTNSTLTGTGNAVTASVFFTSVIGNNTSASNVFTIADGYALYLVARSSTTLCIYATVDAAFAGAGSVVRAGVTVDYTTTILRGWIKLIGSEDPAWSQVQY